MKKEHREKRRKQRARRRDVLLKSMLAVMRPLPEIKKFEGPLNKIAILAQEKLGDAILLTPLFRELKKLAPRVEIHVICLGLNAAFFENDPHVDRVYSVKTDYPAYFRAIRPQSFDVLFNTKDHPSFNFLLHTRLIQARYRVGIQHPMHGGFFNVMLDWPFHTPIVEKNCAILSYLFPGCRVEDYRPYLPPQPVREAIREAGSALRERNGLLVNLSAGEAEREWPPEKWMALLKKINRPVMVLAMPGRYGDKRLLEDALPNVVRTEPTQNIYEAGELIKNARMIITPDTSLIHVASCYNIPVVGLYRADVEHLRRFGPYAVLAEQLISSTPYVRDIGVDEAYRAWQRLESAISGREAG
ncbi:MAG TPA: lipopolysaccharide heptosyltransferase family protein [Caldithrix abyssi]|uniref:Lipopolysaccharide heptosyltransferase family protein n=1 Tax=Caldithrix abyssi TaxID=187145 RepID=A0A7V5RPM3_CALAY|nr:lipopolysaccharide heptosyltransferase family protein [Caldithrix abyssi]